MLIVILVFLQDWRAMLVPATTVPVTIIGAFAAMAALGFTVNLSTLFAIVLAIGIVVDDAIVVVEGASHHIERGLSPHDAAIKAMGELFGPIIGITLVLMSVFIPGGVPARPHRPDVRAVRAGHRRHRDHQRDQRRDVEADAMRAVAARRRCRRSSATSSFAASTGCTIRWSEAISGWSAGMTRLQRPDGRPGASSLAAVGVWGVARLPTAFIPIEDQGYFVVARATSRWRRTGPHAARAR